ncbi:MULTISPECIES: hypothetical protein [Sphingomonadales]|jgi:hypothetical protein|uniref:Uncharacterized protein n=5 Tax=root TaxID=1 RepID=A0A249MZX0_SPHXE|nr:MULTISPECIES: hypothetical protein [Sphingomonadales]MAC57008.1 hypothetical protein [Novosphingobium sp.]TNE45879.1 MAG: hypothetical protein EP345_00845 [Sphingomonadales bacterium]ASY46737.1 hypothetical protein CJD35_19765 [Sphingobium xenophagum]MBB6125536.1 hypothetical protein [Sphingobium subterraneum]MDQ4422011.1 hypothetical protein [Sphingobium sp. DEHP117]|tara:strand:- start:12030 stop:12299 length:270 start_codon:yes stop_codon:yes gene_type:complete
MPLWLDMLRTPMAAPETRDLRRLRRIWQVLCLLLAASVAGLQPLMRISGQAAPCAIASLLAATLLTTALYLARKHRADTAFLEPAGEDQ